MSIKSDEYYKSKVEEIKGYKLIKVIRKNDILLNGITTKDTHVRVYHEYCSYTYDVKPDAIFRRNHRCQNCCGSYEKSLAYYIEVELGESLDKYWDFEKNTVNPYHISRGTHTKIWVKCQERGYHGSYETLCSNFTRGVRCPYCSSTKIHPRDSFAQYHIDNTDPNFLEKYWDYEKNTINPFELSNGNDEKVWIKCQNEDINELNGLMKKDYHGSYKIAIKHFKSGSRCSCCSSKMVHTYDSFGYHRFDKILNWHPDNEISPFKASRASSKKYKFICHECSCEWESSINHISNNRWCPQCSKSKGEQKVKAWLDYNNIKYIHDKEYFVDLLGIKGNPLRPDFILPEHKIWIEYDGEFHYNDFYKDGRYEILKTHDKRKDLYAKNNDWKLIRIPYWDFFNVEKILNYEIYEKS